MSRDAEVFIRVTTGFVQNVLPPQAVVAPRAASPPLD